MRPHCPSTPVFPQQHDGCWDAFRFWDADWMCPCTKFYRLCSTYSSSLYFFTIFSPSVSTIPLSTGFSYPLSDLWKSLHSCTKFHTVHTIIVVLLPLVHCSYSESSFVGYPCAFDPASVAWDYWRLSNGPDRPGKRDYLFEPQVPGYNWVVAAFEVVGNWSCYSVLSSLILMNLGPNLALVLNLKMAHITSENNGPEDESTDFFNYILMVHQYK